MRYPMKRNCCLSICCWVGKKTALLPKKRGSLRSGLLDGREDNNIVHAYEIWALGADA